MKHRTVFGIVTLLLFMQMAVKAQELTLENISWGNPESKRVFIGVPNEFYLSGSGNAQLKAIFPENAEHQTEIGDTLRIQPAQPGPYVVFVVSGSVKHEFIFEADYLPPVVQEIKFVKNNGKVVEGTEIKLSSPDSIFDDYSIAEYTLLVGDKKFVINTNILPIEVINEINLLQPGVGVTIETCRLQNSKLKQVYIGASKTYFPQRES